MRRIHMVMGMPVSLDIPKCDDEGVFAAVFKRLEEIDARYSLYKPGSEASRYRDGQLSEKRLSRELKAIIKACKQAEEATQGFFSAWASGQFDPSGYVKAWAIDQVSHLIERGGYKTFCISAGGDIKATSQSSKIWRIGLQDPRHTHKIIARLAVKNLAVATSGIYERGLHIINPVTRQPADKLLSLTVVGPEIIATDILATAAFVQGDFGVNFIGGQARGYEALAVDRRGRISLTPGMRSLLVDQL